MKKAIAFLAVATLTGCTTASRQAGNTTLSAKAYSKGSITINIKGNDATQDATKQIDALKAAAAVAGKDNAGNADLKGKE